MRTTAFLVLIAAFAVTTLPFEAKDGEDCSNCASHGDVDHNPLETSSHAHGDTDDHHESPDSPCSHQQDFHCCCAHVQAMITMTHVDSLCLVVAENIVLASQDVNVDPSLRQTFHIPIA